MHKNCGISRQVDVEPSVARTDQNVRLLHLPTTSKVVQLTDMLAKLVSVLTPKAPVGTAREPLGPPAQSPGTEHNIC